MPREHRASRPRSCSWSPTAPTAGGLERAARAGIPASCVAPECRPQGRELEAAIDRLLTEAEAELVCLAGFMRILSAGFVSRWHNRLLNIHPSLLPAFPGLDTHARALAAGSAVHGCSVHLVRAAVDQGPILVQGVAPVLPGDTVAALAARVLELEHRCYPRALDLLAGGRVWVEGDSVSVRDEAPGERLILHPRLAP